MYIYGMLPWKVLKCPLFWSEVAVKAWRDLATQLTTSVLNRGTTLVLPPRCKFKCLIFKKTNVPL
jgi:hypothetical protein